MGATVPAAATEFTSFLSLLNETPQGDSKTPHCGVSNTTTAKNDTAMTMRRAKVEEKRIKYGV